MIPLHLSISGFLSYRQRAELDFTAFELACIAGANGAGKSSLLDAITWALFGRARKRDDSLVNAQSSLAEVTFIFAYEGNVYRVQRILPRGKTSQLEFAILQEESGMMSRGIPSGNWKALTERSLRETQERIVKTLRMNYETFTNASFFLQGKADQFTQQPPGDRKRILSSILGLEVWESYRQCAAERRKSLEADVAALDGRLKEIIAELDEEPTRKARLQEKHSELERLSRLRAAQEKAVENTRKMAARLDEQRKLVDLLARQHENHLRRLDELEAGLKDRYAEKETLASLISQKEEIQQAYLAWQQARKELEKWDEVAAQFREQEKRRQPFLEEINAARARLLQEQETLQNRAQEIAAQGEEIKSLRAQLALTQEAIQRAGAERKRRAELEAQAQACRDEQASLRMENPRLKEEMEELKGRIEQLASAEGAVCPICGQPLSPTDRQRLIAELGARGNELGNRYRQNKARLEELKNAEQSIQQEMEKIAQAEEQLLALSQTASQLSTRLEGLEQLHAAWEREGAPRLAEITRQLEEESYAPEARHHLQQVDAELKAIGYDPNAHEAVRRAEAEGRTAEERYLSLEKAQATLLPLERQVAEMEGQLQHLRDEAAQHQTEYEQAAARLAAAEAEIPDLEAAENELLALRQQENRLGLEVGAAQQLVDVLDSLKARRKSLEAEREELGRRIGQYKQLERAFGKDGVPLLLIEQALPQIEAKANEILDRLSNGSMSVRFVTQEAYKDPRRDDLRDTLDIQISDGTGTRDYELFSGGEAFRVNFAIRLALSEVLAQRAGARLQTLVIDEGFGSQDAQGRQRLVEAINLVRKDFAKILVITHLDELKDFFPNRIEVEKTAQGSTIKVI